MTVKAAENAAAMPKSATSISPKNPTRRHRLPQGRAEFFCRLIGLAKAGSSRRPPYFYKDAPWQPANYCVPFGSHNDATECRKRQVACVEYYMDDKSMEGEYPKAGQAGPGIEITPAMLEAGMDEFWKHDLDEEGSSAILRAVFLAMARVGGYIRKT